MANRLVAKFRSALARVPRSRHWAVRFIVFPAFAFLAGDVQLAVLTGCGGGVNCCSTCCVCICGPVGQVLDRPRCSGPVPPIGDNSCISSCTAAQGFNEQCVPK